MWGGWGVRCVGGGWGVGSGECACWGYVCGEGGEWGLVRVCVGGMCVGRVGSEVGVGRVGSGVW